MVGPAKPPLSLFSQPPPSRFPAPLPRLTPITKHETYPPASHSCAQNTEILPKPRHSPLPYNSPPARSHGTDENPRLPPRPHRENGSSFLPRRKAPPLKHAQNNPPPSPSLPPARPIGCFSTTTNGLLPTSGVDNNRQKHRRHPPDYNETTNLLLSKGLSISDSLSPNCAEPWTTL